MEQMILGGVVPCFKERPALGCQGGLRQQHSFLNLIISLRLRLKMNEGGVSYRSVRRS
jgi:hypothetical protein